MNECKQEKKIIFCHNNVLQCNNGNNSIISFEENLTYVVEKNA